jgi:alpha-beta hydrolase superfamily lysophospholipase
LGSILLIHGSAPFDKDGNVPDTRAGRYQHTNIYKDLASALEARGWQVYRYAKPGVTPQGVDYEQYKKTDLASISTQLNAVWNSIPKDRPRLVFAWSEGSLHVRLLPLQEIDGVIFLGGISTNIRDIALAQAQNEAEREEEERQLHQVLSMNRDEMLGIDRPAGRLVDELQMKDNWTYFVGYPTLPILVMHGTADTEVPVSQASVWKKNLPEGKIEVEIRGGLNHMFAVGHQHGAEQIADAICGWWNRVGR